MAGALLGTGLDGVWFNRILALVMLGVMLVMHLDKGAAERRATTGRPATAAPGHLLMVAVGFWGGLSRSVWAS